MPILAASTHPPRRVHRQGEPHVRPGVRATRGVCGDPTIAELGVGAGRQQGRLARPGDGRRLAQSPGARRSIRDQRQLLLRLRPVEHRSPLGRGRVSERMGRGERALAHRAAPFQLRPGTAVRARARARRCCRRTTTRPARCGSTSRATRSRSSTSASAPRCPASLERAAFKDTGIRMSVSFPIPKPLFDRTSRDVSDVQHGDPGPVPRGRSSSAELRERWESGREPFPSS